MEGSNFKRVWSRRTLVEERRDSNDCHERVIEREDLHLRRRARVKRRPV